MPKRSSKKELEANELAARIVELIEQKTEKHSGKNPAAVALGRLGGLKGGKARARKLTAKQRKRIAQKAAKARWEKHKAQD